MGETLLLIGGIYNLFFAGFHLLFWRIFNWRKDLVSLTSINRAIMQVLNLCITWVFIIFGTLSLLYPDQMVETELGNTLIGMIALFWLLRAVEQAIFFKLKNWLSWVFLLVFLGGAGLYALVPFVG